MFYDSHPYPQASCDELTELERDCMKDNVYWRMSVRKGTGQGKDRLQTGEQAEMDRMAI
jgi:hypothetical protein